LSLTIEVDKGRVNQARRRVARQISREISIPGFRKGRAPYDVVVQRLGEGVVRDELVNFLAEELYREALEQAEITPYAPGILEQTQFDPLTLTFTIPLAPEVELGDYRSYRRPFPEVDISEEALSHALEAIQEQNAILAPRDRPAAPGDLLVAHLVGRTSDGDVFVQEEEARIVLNPKASEPVPGLIDALLGIEQDEKRVFTLTLPTDFQVEELQGTEAQFIAEAKTVYERIVPQPDDDLARTVGNYDTFEEMEEDIRQRLQERERTEAENAYADQVMEDIIEQAQVSFPPVILEEAMDDAVEAYERQVERREHMMLEDYLRIQNKTTEDLREELRPGVEHSLQRSLVLGEIVEQEGLAVSDEELDGQIAESSERYGESADEVRAALSAPEGRRDLRNRMLANKAVQRLVVIAKGGDSDVTSDKAESLEMQQPEDSGS
jgi:trigger factor